MDKVVNRVLEQAKAEYPMLHLCTHSGRLAQFEHYRSDVSPVSLARKVASLRTCT